MGCRLVSTAIIRVQSRNQLGRMCALLMAGLFIFSSCSGGTKDQENGGAAAYSHPSTSGGGGAVSSRKSDMVVGVLTEDTSLTLGTTTVKVPSGTYEKGYNIIMSEFGGGFVESDDLRLLSLPVRVKITSDEATLTRSDAMMDIQIEIKSAKAAAEKNLVALLREETDAISGSGQMILSNTAIASDIVASDGGTFKVSFRIRSPDIAFVLAKSTVKMPAGYSEFGAPPKAVSDLSATSTSLSSAQITFKSKSVSTARYALTYSNTGAAPACTVADIISPVETPENLTVSAILAGALKTGFSTFNYALTGLVAGTSYHMRLCVFNSRTPADVSRPSTTVELQMPDPVSAVLSGTPANPSSTSVLAVTVGGTDVLHYKYALLQDPNATSCDDAVYSDWIAIATLITDALPAEVGYRLCVLGKFSESNVQIIPTAFAWTKIATPAFTSINLVNLAADGFLNSSDRVQSSDIVGGLVSSNHDVTGYKIVAAATTCDGALTFAAGIPPANSSDITGDGSWKVCVKLSNAAGGAVTYGASSNFEVD